MCVETVGAVVVKPAPAPTPRSKLRGVVDRLAMEMSWVDSVPCWFSPLNVADDGIDGVMMDAPMMPNASVFLPIRFQTDRVMRGDIGLLRDRCQAAADAAFPLMVSGRMWINEGGGQLLLLVNHFCFREGVAA